MLFHYSETVITFEYIMYFVLLILVTKHFQTLAIEQSSAWLKIAPEDWSSWYIGCARPCLIQITTLSSLREVCYKFYIEKLNIDITRGFIRRQRKIPIALVATPHRCSLHLQVMVRPITKGGTWIDNGCSGALSIGLLRVQSYGKGYTFWKYIVNLDIQFSILIISNLNSCSNED